MKKSVIVLFACLYIAACGQETFKLKEAMNSRNDPYTIPGAVSDLIPYLHKLPNFGTVERVFSSYWWPLSEGGTASTRYGNPSPLGKYDLVTDSRANDWMLSEATRYAGIGWAGRCNGAAASGIMMEEPTKNVLYKNVWFTPVDIKALLAEMWQGSGYIVGDRCDKRAITFDRYGRINDAECRDVNPATFHIALGNYLGLFGKALIGDRDPSEAVWNYPIKAYEVVEKKWITKQDATYRLNKEISTYYSYNVDPNVTEFVYIKNMVTFLGFEPKMYEYILELNFKGEILGGEWLEGSKRDHPDFLWRPLDPRAENPNINVDIIREIYKQSF